MAPLLVAERLSRSYRSPVSLGALVRLRFRREVVPALVEASFTLEPGELLGLVGANGSGKSTLLRVAAGLLLPTGGRLTVAGHAPYAADPAGRRAVGAVFSDSRSFFWRLTGRENLRFFATLHGMAGSARAERVDEVLDVVGLTDAAHRRVMAYSTGMRQRLTIARALVHRPRLLLLDEVTEGLDREFLPRLLALFDALRADGVALLYATHRVDELAGRADRVVSLAKGAPARVLPWAEWAAGADGGAP